MAGPVDVTATAEGCGRGGLRASDGDREQVIDTLKAAFVQGRLTGDELGARVDRVYASRTYAALAEVVADLPTAPTRARSTRSPWRATKVAWWFEYAAFMPGIVAVFLLPGGPSTTVWTLVLLAAVIYLAFWLLGALMIVSRRVQPCAGQPLPPPSWHDREQVVRSLKAALAQGRLTEDEHDARAAQASASRSRAELAALTADLPTDLTTRLPKASYGLTGVCVVIAAVSAAAAIVLWQPDNYPAFALALFTGATLILAPPITVGLIIDARHQRPSGGQSLPVPLGPPMSAG